MFLRSFLRDSGSSLSGSCGEGSDDDEGVRAVMSLAPWPSAKSCGVGTLGSKLYSSNTPFLLLLQGLLPAWALR